MDDKTNPTTSVNDVASLTPPPPAPVMSESTDQPKDDSGSMPSPVDTDQASTPPEDATQGDYQFTGEDLMEEILDSLDRIEAKLEDMDKRIK